MASPRTSRSCRPCSTTPTSSPATSRRRSSRPTRSCCQARGSGDRGTKLLTYLAGVTVNQPHGPAPVSIDPVSKLPRPQPRRPRPRRHPSAAAERRARGVRPPAARAEGRRGHRHHVPRRPPVAARDAGPHPRPAGGGAARRPDDAGAVVARGVGRGDVRRGAAVPVRGPVGAAGRAAPGGAEHLPPDAAARAQHRRVHAVPDRGHRRVRRGGRARPASTCSASSTRSTTSSRCGRRSRRCARPTPPSRRSALCYTGDLSDPGEKLYTLDYYLAPGRADRRGRRARAGDQGHGRAAARTGRPHAGDGAARPLRPARAPAHARHPGRPARHPARGDRRRGRRGRRRDRVHGRHHLPAAALRAGLGDRPLRARDRAVAGGGERARALLGGRPPGVRAVRGRPALAHRSRLPARDPRRPAVQPAPAGHRARAGREVRADRGHVRRRQRHPRQRGEGDPVVEGGRRPGAAPRRGRRRPGGVRREPEQVRHPRLGHRLPQRRARRPARRLAGAVPEQGARGPHLEGAGRARHRRAGRRAAHQPPQTLNELLFPGPTKEFLEVRETYGDVSVLPTRDYLYGLRPARSTRSGSARASP